MDSIPIEELTITLVTGKYPRKLIHHLKTKLRYQVKKAESGIYYVTGDKIPIQIIVTKELTEAENLWLKSLTNRRKIIGRIFKKSGKCTVSLRHGIDRAGQQTEV